MKRNRKLWLTMLLMSICICVLTGTALAANPTSVKLTAGKTYTAYDITGDQQADTILISQEKMYHNNDDTGVYQSMAVTVNGQKVYSLNKVYFYLAVKLYTLENGTPYLYIDATSDDYGVTVSGLFQYQEGKLKKVLDFHNIAQKCGVGQGAVVKAVNGNTLTVEYEMESYALSHLQMRCRYQYSNGTLKPTTKTAALRNIGFKTAPRTLKTRIRLTAYASTTSNKKTFVIPAGKSVKVDRCYFNKKYMRFRVKYKGKYGWIKAATSCYEIDQRGMFSKQFKNLQVGI